VQRHGLPPEAQEMLTQAIQAQLDGLEGHGDLASKKKQRTH